MIVKVVFALTSFRTLLSVLLTKDLLQALHNVILHSRNVCSFTSPIFVGTINLKTCWNEAGASSTRFVLNSC